MIRVLCCVPLLVLFHLGQGAPVHLAEPSPVAGNATEAAVPWAAAPAEAPPTSTNATEAAVPGENLFASAGTPEKAAVEREEETPPVVACRRDDILVSHINTYDLPKEEWGDNRRWGDQRPDRVFELMFSMYSPIPADNLVLHTNVGIGVTRDQLDEVTIHHYATMEIVCRRGADDDCDADAIVIYGATSFMQFNDDPHRVMRDELPRLRKDPYPRLLPLETKKGLLPLPGTRAAVNSKASPDVLIRFDYLFDVIPGNRRFRLTFPPGERERYRTFLLSTSQGYTLGWDRGEEPTYTAPNAVLLWVLSGFPWEEDARLRPQETPAYVPETAGTLGEKGIFINEAWAFEGKKKIDLLPRLVQDPFKPLPLRTADGLLPTLPLNEYGILSSVF